MPPVEPAALHKLWRLPPSSPELQSWLQAVSNSPTTAPSAEVKSYPDEDHHNYYALGISLTFTADQNTNQSLGLDRIDIYNPPSSAPAPAGRRKKVPEFNAPELPITFHFPTPTLQVPSDKPGEPSRAIERPSTLPVDRKTTGKGFVACLGEPTKKSEGKIIGSMGLDLWMEWDRVDIIRSTSDQNEHPASEQEVKKEYVGVLVELRPSAVEQQQQAAGGPWDRAASWEWSCLKLFDPSASQRP